MKRPLAYIFYFDVFSKFDKKQRRTKTRRFPAAFKDDVFEYVKQHVNAKNFFDYMSKKYYGFSKETVIDIDEEIKEFREMNEELKKYFLNE